MKTPLVSCYFRRSGRGYCVQAACGFTDVLSEHTTRFVLCGEPTESSDGSTYQDVLEGSKACIEIPQRHISVWIMVQMDRGSEATGLH